jgi:hypothetical protein
MKNLKCVCLGLPRAGQLMALNRSASASSGQIGATAAAGSGTR